jgi:hypothetical protein
MYRFACTAQQGPNARGDLVEACGRATLNVDTHLLEHVSDQVLQALHALACESSAGACDLLP